MLSMGLTARAQQLTLPNAISIAQQNSYDAQLAKLEFMSKYWTFRSFQADLRPSINLNGSVGNFDHSLVAVRNYNDGQVAYVNNNSLSNQLTLSVNQKIAATGEPYHCSHTFIVSISSHMIRRLSIHSRSGSAIHNRSEPSTP